MVRGTRTWIACRLSVLLAVVIAMGFAAPAGAAVQPVGDATATVETVPVLSTGDAADDPAVWVHPSDPARSVVIGNDKGGALEVYDLSGARIQRIACSKYSSGILTRPRGRPGSEKYARLNAA